jgi:hypothetical protein
MKKEKQAVTKSQRDRKILDRGYRLNLRGENLGKHVSVRLQDIDGNEKGVLRGRVMVMRRAIFVGDRLLMHDEFVGHMREIHNFSLEESIYAKR